MKTAPLQEAMRPGCRSQCGDRGKSMHDLADYIEKHWPNILVEIPPAGCRFGPKDWLQIKLELSKLDLPDEENHRLALERISELTELTHATCQNTERS